MFWLLTALKYVEDDVFPERIWNVKKVVFELIGQISGNGVLKIILCLKQLTQYHCCNRHVALVRATVIQHPPDCPDQLRSI